MNHVKKADLLKKNTNKEEIAVIGGGLGGCMTALMLAKRLYHVTLIDEQSQLLNGASLLASRLHLGGEYPLDPKTASDCLNAAIAWKLLMPGTIYTPAPPMKFLIAEETQKIRELQLETDRQAIIAAHTQGIKGHNALRTFADNARSENATNEKAVTWQEHQAAYEAILHEYKKIFDRLREAYKWTAEEAAKKLFGYPLEWKPDMDSAFKEKCTYYNLDPHDPRIKEKCFYHSLEPHEYADYNQGDAKIAGGFQSQELGLNVVKYLTMLQQEINAQVKNGNIRVLTNHKVNKKGIKELSEQDIGKLGEEDREKLSNNHGFEISCTVRDENGNILENNEKLISSQVVQAAWSGGPAISPPFNTPIKKIPDGVDQITVFKRAMLLVELPPNWKTSPAFIMLGKHGGMLSPYNDHTAVCYLPIKEAAYVDDCRLDYHTTELYPDWHKMPRGKEFQERAEEYLKLLERRFPVLKGAKIRRIIARDTINFQQELHQRENRYTTEYSEPVSQSNIGITMEQVMHQEMRTATMPTITESKLYRGLFNLYPTKATYSLFAAIQAAEMVAQRSMDREKELQTPEDPLGLILEKDGRGARRFTLEYMKEPLPTHKKGFLKSHPDLDQSIDMDSWLGKTDQKSQKWQSAIKKGGNQPGVVA